MTTALILAQAADPASADAARDALGQALEARDLDVALLVRLTGPYDVVAQVDGPDHQIAAAVVTAGLDPAIARTLTLPHVTQEPTR